MKILIEAACPGGCLITQAGWVNALNTNHEVYFWDKSQEATFDVFNKFEPDLFIGFTYTADRALHKNIVARPRMRVVMRGSDYGDVDIDLHRFPVLVANQQEIDIISKMKEETGKPDVIHSHYPDRFIKHTHSKWAKLGIHCMGICNAWCPIRYGYGRAELQYEADISFIGSCHPYKARTIIPYLYRLLHPVGKYNIKIYGTGFGAPQFLGILGNDAEKDVFASSKICPNISEPHSQVYGYDLVERVPKVMGNGQSLMISDFADGWKDLYTEAELIMARCPQEFEDKIAYFLKKENREERKQFQIAGYKATLKSHSYFHRMSDLFLKLGLTQEAGKMMLTYKQILDRNNQSWALE